MSYELGRQRLSWRSRAPSQRARVNEAAVCVVVVGDRGALCGCGGCGGKGREGAGCFCLCCELQQERRKPQAPPPNQKKFGQWQPG